MTSPLGPCVLPDGTLALRAYGDAPPLVDEALTRGVTRAFQHGSFAGLLHLGAHEPATALASSWRWLRDFARSFVARLCAHPDLEALRGDVSLDAPPEDELLRAVEATPAMPGAEYVSTEVLRAWWEGLHGAFSEAIAASKGSAEQWLQSQSPLWHRVGRVCFHLAERKGDAGAPFAFLATFTTGVSSAGRVQHTPLGRALQEASATKDTDRLDALLEPVRRAAGTSAVTRALVDSGELFRPLAWSAAQAYAFLRDVAAMEAAGVSVRVPDWWKPHAPVRPQVQVTVGGTKRSYVTADDLLDFSVEVALDGEALTDEELSALRSTGAGLVQLRGRWVEVDAARLDALLAQWRKAQRAARDGVSMHEALRMVAGAMSSTHDGALPTADTSGWLRINPGAWLKDLLRALRDPSSLGDVDPGSELNATLRPYQRVGIRWLWYLWRIGLGGCLADDMGLGKTLQVIALMVLDRRHREGAAPPHLLVVPASLMANWRAELTRFAPSLRAKIAHPSAGRDAPPDALEEARAWRADADVIITTYGAVARSAWLKELPWSLAVIDEAQAIKNADTQQARAVKALRAKGRLALTGTPVENRLGDLWSIFDFLQPGLLGSAKTFSRYAKSLSEGASYGPLRALVGPYILRRLKSDKSVVSDLPDKTEVTAWCRLTRAQATAYSEVAEGLRQRLDGGGDPMERRGAVLAALTRFKQVCNHPSQASGDGRYDPAESGKFERLREIAEEVSARGEKMLVFTQFQEITEALAAFLSGVFDASGLILHGATPVKERAKRVDTFQRDSRAPFFVLSLKAGGTGLNLTAAQHVVHFDRWWNPAVESQATDRAYRIGQRRNVMVHRFVCKGTLEERVDAMLADKRALSGAILDAGAGELKLSELSDEALMKLVSLDITSALDEG